MCGIVGFTGNPNRKILEKMADAIFHRGPDSDGYYFDDVISIGMRRLSIVDLEMGEQPVYNEDGSIVVVCNGEIYNHQELRSKLIEFGHVFRSHHSDTEVIVHLYEEYGDDWGNKVNGMFGVAIWDRLRGRLLLYRDRLGKKPLYYAHIGNRLFFGSEIKAILKHPDVPHDLNNQGLFYYFCMKNISAPKTAFAVINQLLPGHLLEWRADMSLTKCYWEPDFTPNLDVAKSDAERKIMELLDDAVRIRMNCDVPYGAYLSGGVDSSAVVTLMKRHQSGPIKTFCLGYDDKVTGQFIGKQDDVQYAREMAVKLGTDHHEFIINHKIFSEMMPEVIASFDEPFSGTISTFFLSIYMKKYVKVAISGDGADELFGSYLAPRLAFPIQRYLSLKSEGKVFLSDMSQKDRDALAPFNTPESFRLMSSLASTDMIAWRAKGNVFDESELPLLLTPEFLDLAGHPAPDEIYRLAGADLSGADILNRVLEVDQKEILANQVLPFVDRLSMAHSIEVRCPFLDYRLVEFVNRLPGSFKIQGGSCKHILKTALRNVLPIEVIDRPKEGFVQPIYSWMHGPLKDWTQDNLRKLPGDLFRKEYIKEIEKRFIAGDTSLNAKIWNLVAFKFWFEEFCV